MIALLILAQEYMLLGGLSVNHPQSCWVLVKSVGYFWVHLIKLITISSLLHSQGASVTGKRQVQFVDQIN